MGFISASFKTTTPTLQSQMLTVKENLTLAWSLHACEIAKKKEKKSSLFSSLFWLTLKGHTEMQLGLRFYVVKFII